MERLAALGYVQTASLTLRPWTRLECARVLTEFAQRTTGMDTPDTDVPEEVQQLYSALSQEFAHESGLMGGDSNSTSTGIRLRASLGNFGHAVDRQLPLRPDLA